MINGIINKKLTGNLIVLCANNKSAQLSFDKGEIVGLRCGAFMGNKAMEDLINTEFLSLRFIDSKHLIKSDIPAQIQSIVDRLKLIDSDNEVINKNISQIRSSDSDLQISDMYKFSEEVKALLTDYLGPAASFIFDETKQNVLTGESLTSEQLTQFLIFLAGNINDGADSKKFLDIANNLVKKYSK